MRYVPLCGGGYKPLESRVILYSAQLDLDAKFLLEIFNLYLYIRSKKSSRIPTFLLAYLKVFQLLNQVPKNNFPLVFTSILTKQIHLY